MQTNGIEPRIVRADDLEPTWTVKQAKEPGFMRSLITWVGGPEGCINTNPGVAVETRRSVTGLMRMPPGNRQAGVHVHTVTEIYVILKGRCESFDGDEELELIWVHDAIERWGVSTYLDGPGPFPADDEVRLIRFDDLEPQWTAPGAREVGTLCWTVNWVAGPEGPDHDPGVATTNGKMALGLTAVEAWNRLPPEVHAGDETQVILSGAAIAEVGGARHRLGRLDAIWRPAGREAGLRNAGDTRLHLLWVRDAPGPG